MYAVIRTGGKQYRVEEKQRLRVSKLDAGVGAEVRIDQVLMVGGEGDPTLGAPVIANALVVATVVAHGRGPKIRGFTFKAKKNQRRRFGHRQDYTELRVDSISLAGPPPRRRAARAAPAKETPAVETKATESEEERASEEATTATASADDAVEVREGEA